MGRLVINNSANDAGNRIVGMEAGELFEFTSSRKGNNGLCVRVKDSKAGKGRFLNVESGKLLKAGKYDTGEPRDGTISLD